jgi:hypothetical protein
LQSTIDGDRSSGRYGEGVILNLQAKNLVCRNQLRRAAEMLQVRASSSA